MKAKITILNSLFLLFTLCAFNSYAQTYNLVWSEEFNGSISSAWRHETGGGGWGNNEKQFYQSANTSVTSTELIITARKQSMGGLPYTSSRLITNGSASPKSFTYGRMESRMRLPMGQGLWPAFWMLGTNIGSIGWPSCGEIDIMEHINNDATIFGTIHWQGPSGYASYGKNSFATTPAAYHTYRVDWTPNDIKWFIDGTQYHIVSIANSVNSTEEFHRPMFFILNLAVAGNFPGQAVDESRLPATMAVDYVRVYQTSGSSNPSAFSRTYEGESFAYSAGVMVEGCSEGGSNVGSFDAGDWTAYNISVPTSGTYRVSYRVASPYSGKSLILQRNNGTINVGTVGITHTGHWQAWTTVSHNVYLPSGSYPIGIATSTGGFNLNKFTIEFLGARLAPEEVSIEQPSASAISVYPNPVSNKLNYKLPEGLKAHNITIKDFNGKAVSNYSFGEVGSENALDLSNLKKGLYIINISDKGFSKTFKIEKE